ncbi:hypothetical protein [Saccharopolyspora taberi]
MTSEDFAKFCGNNDWKKSSGRTKFRSVAPAVWLLGSGLLLGIAAGLFPA